MTDSLPLIIAGPVLRHCTADCLTFWLMTSEATHFQLQVEHQQNLLVDIKLSEHQHNQVQVGKHCFIQQIHVQLDKPLPQDCYLHYDLLVGEHQLTLAELVPGLCYPGDSKPGFMLKTRADNILHGSCRKPHFDTEDGLLKLDDVLGESRSSVTERPAMMMMSGDQVYVDDVAGPTLSAVHQVIERLGLFDESFDGAIVDNSQALFDSAQGFYHRYDLLPDIDANETLVERFFGGARKPIFTSVGAHNHLISFSEVVAMYSLVWSPTCWQWADLDIGVEYTQVKDRSRYLQEKQVIQDFVSGLERVQRAMAHIPCYMIFDDHDITDDWNLTRGWEESAYGHPFSRRIIGNALIGYWLCQGWGNMPDNFQPLTEAIPEHFSREGLVAHDALVDTLLDWQHWHYHLNTHPKVVVLDTRTHRWRSESSANKPSGLMDWEALSEMQQELIGEPAVVLVSPAPVFGVKLIEAIQRIFTFFGKALMVDAENWMAHPGAANVILNIFRHPKTPPNFVILSGDVHYSFVYDITLRFRRHSPKILQVTASGIKNCFPDKLLGWFDRINIWLYGSRSPLNWFTKRRDMLIKRRRPEGMKHRVLLNQSGIGQVLLSDDFEKTEARILGNDKTVSFR